jgi:voltage-gated sodium channel
MTDPVRSEPGWQASARRLVESTAFGNLIVAVILLNAVTIGVQTYAIPAWLHTGLEWADRLFLVVFVVELVLRFCGGRVPA